AMPGLFALCLVLVALLPAAAGFAVDSTAPSSPGLLPPTAPSGDFNGPGQSSSALVAAMHIRGPEKLIGAAVVVLLLIALVMFAGMLRHAYGGPRARRP